MLFLGIRISATKEAGRVPDGEGTISCCKSSDSAQVEALVRETVYVLTVFASSLVIYNVSPSEENAPWRGPSPGVVGWASHSVRVPSRAFMAKMRIRSAPRSGLRMYEFVGSRKTS